MPISPESMTSENVTELPKVINRSRKTKEQHKLAAKLLSQGLPISKALTQAGWSKQNANRGKRALTQPIVAELLKQNVHLEDLGRELLASPEQMHRLAAGRTGYAVLTGDEKGLQAAKQLGSHKSVNCWQQDVSTGVIVIQMQQPMQDSLSKPILTLPEPEE